MPIPRPPKGVRWLLAQPQTYAIAIAIVASLVGFSSVYNYLSQQKQGVAYVVGLATIGIVALTIIQNAVGLAAARKKDSTHELEGCLYTLHAVLAPPDGCRLRLAIHVPVGETLEQVTEYIGDTPKSQGRTAISGECRDHW